jgi:hypothetical protein
LIYYIEDFGGEMRYQLRDKEPTTLKGAQEVATKIDKNMQASGKSNLLSATLGITKEIMSRGPQVLDMEYLLNYELDFLCGLILLFTSIL